MDTIDIELFPAGAITVAIGKAIIDTKDKDYNIPHLHFIIIQGLSPDGSYDALNLEYGLHFGHTVAKDAFLGAFQRVLDYFEVNQIDTKEGFLQLLEEQDNLALSDYWREFRKMEMKLATQKKDLGSTLFYDLRTEIDKEIQKIEKREEELAMVYQKQEILEELLMLMAKRVAMRKYLVASQSLQFVDCQN